MTATDGWFLEGYIDGEQMPRRIAIATLPFRIGRASHVEAHLPVHHVSDLHAEIYLRDDGLWLRDQNSSNGTFCNRERLGDDVPLREGDIIHVSTNEFILRREAATAPKGGNTVLLPSVNSLLPKHFITGTNDLKELLDQQLVTPHFQPLVQLIEHQPVIGYEVLGRGSHERLPESPNELFAIAEAAGLEVGLSQLFRRKGLYLAQVLHNSPKIFVNSHPAEIGGAALIDSLRDIREAMPEAQIVLETKESAVQSTTKMRNLRDALSDLQIGLAYDDFGAGHARLAELVEVPPDLLKFDTSLVRGIDSAPVARQKMLETLVHMVNDLGIQSLAEGLETANEVRLCRELGFGYAQGRFLGSPAPVHSWLRPKAEFGEVASDGVG